MDKELNSDEARSNFRDLLNEVEHNGEHITVMRYNRPAVVVVPVEWYREAVTALTDGAEGYAG